MAGPHRIELQLKHLESFVLPLNYKPYCTTYENRTRLSDVTGQCTNRYTNVV